VITGGGPAGSSLAIRLAASRFDVTLIEREHFPRHKLCGEFISPECLSHFDQLGVLDSLLAAGGQRVYETHFYDRRGKGFAVPSGVFDGGGFALSLSRSEMDARLLMHARRYGVNVLEGWRPTTVHMAGDLLRAVETVGENGESRIFEADLFVDATGRSRALSKLVERSGTDRKRSPGKASVALGFKTHIRNAELTPGRCEIYSFPSGYGGLTTIEGGLANLCFLIDPRAARSIGTDPGVLMERAVRANRRAAAALEGAQPVRDWLAVSVNAFGRAGQPPAKNLFTAGDAAAFIDPFTGSGILMALESSALLASAIGTGRSSLPRVESIYRSAFEETFSRRLRICSLLRRTAFLPVLPSVAIRFLSFSRRGRSYVAGSTRTPHADRPKVFGSH
jgi:flavin-dependent dehydrogenase